MVRFFMPEAKISTASYPRKYRLIPHRVVLICSGYLILLQWIGLQRRFVTIVENERSEIKDVASLYEVVCFCASS